METQQQLNTLLQVFHTTAPYLLLDQTMLKGEDAFTRQFGHNPGKYTYLCRFTPRLAVYIGRRLLDAGLAHTPFVDWQTSCLLFRACVLVDAHQTRDFIHLVLAGACD
jgi:hypothetical protein